MEQPVYYMQTDPKWKNVDYSAPGETTTIGKAGCGCVSAAMVIATLRDENVTPLDTCKWSLENGYKALRSGTYYSYFVPQLAQYDIECERLNFSNIYGKPKAKEHDIVKEYLEKGHMVIACMGKGLWTKSGHYILAWGIEDGYVLINDPNSKSANKTKAPWETFISQVKYYFVIKETATVKYKYLTDIPDNFKPIIEQLMNADIIQGDGSDPTGNGDIIDLTHEQVRTLVFMYRGGGFDRKLKAKGFTPVVSD